MRPLDYQALFHALHPGFFDSPDIRRKDESLVYEEMALWLRDFSVDDVRLMAPSKAAFGLYDGDKDALLRAVAEVDESWPRFYDEKAEVYCAMAEGQIASFCLLEDMGQFEGLKIAGPGCVGTVPAFRRQGIGLKMVQKATEILRQRGYDLSYIHYTGVGPWYARLGYRTVLRWNKDGFLPNP